MKVMKGSAIIRLYLEYVGIDIVHAININIFFTGTNYLLFFFTFPCTFYDMGWFSLKIFILSSNCTY